MPHSSILFTHENVPDITTTTMTDSNSPNDDRTPTQASFNEAVARQHLEERITRMRQGLLRVHHDDLAEESRHRNLMILGKALARDRNVEGPAQSTPGERRTFEPEMSLRPNEGLRRVPTHRNFQHMHSQLPSLVPSRNEPKYRPAPIATYPSAPQHGGSRSMSSLDMGDVHTARPLYPHNYNNYNNSVLQDQLKSSLPLSKSTDSLASQAEPQIHSPQWQDIPPSAVPEPEIVDGQVMMTPYMTHEILLKVFDHLPEKLRILLRANNGGYWPYIQEWYRQQREEDLDNEAIHLCEQMQLNKNLTLAFWNKNVEYGSKLRSKKASETEESKQKPELEAHGDKKE